jgi:3-methyl-2-oxobutanoate hydroxymethyltransferase
MALTKHARLTVADLRRLKGKRQLTMLFVETPEEAAAASAAGIDILSIIEPPWCSAMREAAGDCFVQVGLIYGQHCTTEDFCAPRTRM